MKIRKLNKKDLQLRVEWMNHSSIYSTMHYELPVTLELTERWFDSNLTSNQRADVVFTLNDTPVGMGGLTSIKKKERKAELYIFINPNMQGMGYGTKAMSLLCNYGFDSLSLNKIYLEVDEENIAGRNLYKKCGFVLEGILREESLRNGRLINRCVYSLLKREYK